MDTKKISFGFSKVAKKPNILPTKPAKEENNVELIRCLEGKEIKLVAEKQDAGPLVIPMQTNQKTSAALASLMKRRAVLLGEDDHEPEATEAEAQSIPEVTAKMNGESLEQRAARELLAGTTQLLCDGDGVQEKLVLPALKADELPLDGAKEATMEDYEDVPIQQFGLAMLRGMGWVDPPPKKKGEAPVDDAPAVRPKGMGLGADKALKPKPLLVQPETNEKLEIRKQAYVRILGGKMKDQYGQIEGFDDHAGRVIVKMAIGGNKEAFNEFLCQPVSKKEYAQYGKCINTAKYEEYKKQENEYGQIIVKQEKAHVKTERRDRNYRESERKDYQEERRYIKDEERKPYKSEERKPCKEEPRKTYKTEERLVFKRDAAKYGKPTSNSRYQEIPQRPREERNSRRSRSHSPRTSNSRRQQSSSDEAEDTGESTESDSDSAYERKHKQSSSSKSKKKKSKKTKSKSRRRRPSVDSSDESDSNLDERSRHKSKHKKKTKKSKHARSRTRSRSRDRVRVR